MEGRPVLPHTHLLPPGPCRGQGEASVDRAETTRGAQKVLGTWGVPCLSCASLPQAEKYEDSAPQSNGELAVRAKLVLPSGPRKLQEAQGTDELSLNGQLCLVVLGAKNLPVRPDGTLNSFVKGCLTLPDQQKLRLKSPVLKKQACPQWKHSFVFSGVTPAQLRQSSLELTVWDQALLGMNDRLLGGARLGSKGDTAGGGDACSQSKLQWQKVLSSPNLWTDMTLVLH